jgi:hypothetical protein
MKTRHNRLGPIRPIPGLSQFALQSLPKSSLTFKVKEPSRNYPGIGFIKWREAMVSVFKLSPKSHKIYPISRDTVERVIGRKAPWFSEGKTRDDHRVFAICPYCNNAIQMIGLYRGKGAQRPYGRHLAHQHFAFAPHNPAELAFCPYADPSNRRGSTDRRGSTASAAALALLRLEFDRIVFTLNRDTGVDISLKQAAALLNAFLQNEGWSYRDAHLRNMPWMVIYQGRNLDLFGLRVRDGAMRTSISTRNPAAVFTSDDRLQSQKDDAGRSVFIRFELQFLYHRQVIGTDHQLRESLTLRVLDYSGEAMGDDASCFERTFQLDFDRFERLIATPTDRARRNAALLEIARRLIPQEIVR